MRSTICMKGVRKLFGPGLLFQQIRSCKIARFVIVWCGLSTSFYHHMVFLGLPGVFTEPFFKGVEIPLMDRRLVRFSRRRSLTAQCILHVVGQRIRIEPGRANRVDYATDD